MGRLGTPVGRAENPNKKRVFPQGLYEVSVDRVLDTDVFDWMTTVRYDDNDKPKVPYLRSADADVVTIQFGSAEPADEGVEEAGNQKLFWRLVLRDGDVELEEFDWDVHKEQVGYRLSSQSALFVNFAHSLGYTTVDEGVAYLDDGFVDALKDGELDGSQVLVQTKHTAGKDDNVYVDPVSFSPAL